MRRRRKRSPLTHYPAHQSSSVSLSLRLTATALMTSSLVSTMRWSHHPRHLRVPTDISPPLRCSFIRWRAGNLDQTLRSKCPSFPLWEEGESLPPTLSATTAPERTLMLAITMRVILTSLVTSVSEKLQGLVLEPAEQGSLRNSKASSFRE